MRRIACIRGSDYGMGDVGTVGTPTCGVAVTLSPPFAPSPLPPSTSTRRRSREGVRPPSRSLGHARQAVGNPCRC